jgi:hypothetical protein
LAGFAWGDDMMNMTTYIELQYPELEDILGNETLIFVFPDGYRWYFSLDDEVGWFCMG